MLHLQNHLPTMRNYGKLVANCGTKSSTYYEKYAKLLATVVQNHLPTMRNYGKLVANCGTKSSTYYEKLC